MDMTEVDKFEPQVGVLKLSDAIRVGARLRPQCSGWAFISGKSCALGAAYEGRTGHACSPEAWEELSRVVPEGYRYDASGLTWGPVGYEIVKRNDSGQTREQIADWLQSKGY